MASPYNYDLAVTSLADIYRGRRCRIEHSATTVCTLMFSMLLNDDSEYPLATRSVVACSLLSAFTHIYSQSLSFAVVSLSNSSIPSAMLYKYFTKSSSVV
jgi:hypothetical protein